MTTSCRSWWRNCALEADSEIEDIDRIEDDISPITSNVLKIRELISSLELCHHKAERWVCNIIEAIGAGETTKGLGTRPPRRQHPSEIVWQSACDALSKWCAGWPCEEVDLTIDTIPASGLLACLGEPSPLKEWQVKRVIEKVSSLIPWAQSGDDQAGQYVWLLLSGDEYEVAYLNECPEHYKGNGRFLADHSSDNYSCH